MFHPHFAAHVFEAALSASHVEVGRIRRQVLRIHIELHVAVGHGHVGLRVVLHVVGAQLQVPVLNFHFAVGEK